MAKRVFVLGLDAFTPQLYFERFKGQFPNLSTPMEESAWGRSNGVIPPLSCTSWVAFAKGKNPLSFTDLNLWLYSSWISWHGAWSFGNRFFAILFPVAVIGLGAKDFNLVRECFFEVG